MSDTDETTETHPFYCTNCGWNDDHGYDVDGAETEAEARELHYDAEPGDHYYCPNLTYRYRRNHRGGTYYHCSTCGWTDCGPWNDEGGARYHNHLYLCPSCAETLGYCDVCGDTYWTDDEGGWDDDAYSMCGSCWEEHQEEQEREMSYSDLQASKVHYDPLNEVWLTDAEAADRLARNLPVVLTRSIDGVVTVAGRVEVHDADYFRKVA